METDWQTLAAIHILVGFESGLLGFLPFAGFFLTGVQFRRGSNDEWKATEGLLIAGFLCYAVVAVIVSLQKFAKLKAAEKVISIINIVLLVLAGNLNQHPNSFEISTCVYVCVFFALYCKMTLTGNKSHFRSRTYIYHNHNAEQR